MPRSTTDSASANCGFDLLADAGQRAEFLASASQLLADSLDVEITLRRIGRLLVPALADWCTIDLLGRDGALVRVATANADPTTERLIPKHLMDSAPSLLSDSPIARVFHSRRPLRMEHITPDWLQRAARDPEHLALLEQLRVSSSLIVPLVARGQTLGVIALQCGSSERHYSEAAEQLVEDLAGRAALAVDNARLLQEARDARQEAELGQRRILDVASSLDALLWEYDLASQSFQFISEQRFLGYDATEVLGSSTFMVERFVHADDRARVLEDVARAVRTGDDSEMEYRAYTATGELAWVRAIIHPIRNENGWTTHINGITLDVTEHKRREAALRALETRHALVARLMNDVLYEWDLDSNIITWSDAAAAVFRYRREDVQHTFTWWAERVHPDDQERAMSKVYFATDRADTTWGDEYRFRRGDGTWAVVFDRGFIERDVHGNVRRVIGSIVDVTERKSLENQLRHAQKMDAIGQLAGGIAHDFNNLLTVIASFSELAREDVDNANALSEDLAEIAKATARAKALTGQLLTFSRRQPVQTVVLDLHEIIRDAKRMFTRVLGEDVHLDLHLDAPSARVRADRGQLEQVLLNLLVNAREAMPAGGRIEMRTALAEANAVLAAPEMELEGGRYVLLSVTDTGHGMDEETRRRVFEPFFTTKEVGKGTGLGLAMAYAIIRQSGGAIDMLSTPGEGSTVRIYLPLLDRATSSSERDDPRLRALGGSETILVVEDETPVRLVTRRILEKRGYSVLEADNGLVALDIIDQQRDAIALVLSDVVMPVMGGHDFLRELRSRGFEVPVVFMSGYAGDGEGPQTVAIHKPFTAEGMLRVVRDTLDRAHG